MTGYLSTFDIFLTNESFRDLKRPNGDEKDMSCNLSGISLGWVPIHWYLRKWLSPNSGNWYSWASDLSK